MTELILQSSTWIDDILPDGKYRTTTIAHDVSVFENHCSDETLASSKDDDLIYDEAMELSERFIIADLTREELEHLEEASAEEAADFFNSTSFEVRRILYTPMDITLCKTSEWPSEEDLAKCDRMQRLLLGTEKDFKIIT